jgi:hypothetical protein
MGWQGLINRMVVPSIWNVSLPSTEKGWAGITRKGRVEDLDPKVH